jgi:hypothetical protein
MKHKDVRDFSPDVRLETCDKCGHLPEVPRCIAYQEYSNTLWVYCPECNAHVAMRTKDYAA